MIDRIEPVHAGEAIEQRADHRQADIGKADIGRDVGDFRQELAGAVRAFEIEQLHAADAQLGQDRDSRHDDADPADPVQDGAPQEEAARQVLKAGKNGRAGRRHAGDAFEDRVGDRISGNQEREGTDEVDDDPDADRQQEGFALADLHRAAARHHPEQAADQSGNGGGGGEDEGHAFAIGDVNQRTRDHRCRDQQHHDSQRVDDGPKLHSRAA